MEGKFFLTCSSYREKENTITFLDAAITGNSDGLLTTTVYRKPTHTVQYLAYDSHHPQSVKRGIVECLYDEANTSPQNRQLCLRKETLVISTWLSFFICKKTRKDNKGNSQQRIRVGILIYCRSPLRKRCIRGSLPLPTTSRHTNRFQVGHNT